MMSVALNGMLILASLCHDTVPVSHQKEKSHECEAKSISNLRASPTQHWLSFLVNVNRPPQVKVPLSKDVLMMERIVHCCHVAELTAGMLLDQVHCCAFSIALPIANATT